MTPPGDQTPGGVALSGGTVTLPIKPLPTGTVTIEGTDVPIRALSYTEIMDLGRLGSEDESAEYFMVSCGAGVSLADAEAWVRSTDGPTVEKMLAAISTVSGLKRDPQAGSTGDGAAERRSSEP